MASAKIFIGRWGSEWRGYVDELSVDIPNNRSRVRVRGILYNGGSARSWTGGNVQKSISGGASWTNNSGGFDVAARSTQTIIDVQFDIPHNADGTKTVTFNIRVGNTPTQTFGSGGTVKVTITLTRIPRGPRVRSGGVWRNTIAYVRSGGVWRIALPYVRTGGTWKLGGG